MNVSTLWKNKKNKVVLLMTAWLLSLSPQALSAARQFETVRRSGIIWVMPPLGSDWQKLKTKSMDEGSLLRLDPGASIELKQIGRDLSAAETEARLLIAEPMIVRVDRHIFKNLRFKDYVVDGLWNEGASQEKEATQHPLLNFSAAFVRHLLSIETAQELPKLKADPQKDKLESAQKISNLALLSPGQDSLHFISEKSAQIPLYWESPDDRLSFKIFLWPAADIKREPLATVQGHRYLLTIREPGSYRLQISSVDYRFRSEVLRLTVDRPLAIIPAEDPLTQTLTREGIRQTPALEIQFPPADLELAAPTAKAETLFLWTDRDGLKAGDQYRLVVQGENGKELAKVATQETFVKLSLPPGSWHYFVMKQNRVTHDAPVASASRRLRVLDRKTATEWRRLGRKAHSLQRDETVLLDLR